MNMNEERTSQVMTLELQGHYFSYLLLSVIFRLDNGSEDQTLAYFRGKYVKRLLSLRSSQVVFDFLKQMCKTNQIKMIKGNFGASVSYNCN